MISKYEYEELKKQDFIQEYDKLLVLKYGWVKNFPWILTTFLIGMVSSTFEIFFYFPTALSLPIYLVVFVIFDMLSKKEKTERCKQRLALIDAHPEIYAYRNYKRMIEENNLNSEL